MRIVNRIDHDHDRPGRDDHRDEDNGRNGAASGLWEQLNPVNFFRAHTRAIVVASAFAAVVLLISYAIYISLETWREEVIRTNETLTKVVAEQLHSAAQDLVDSLGQANFFHQESLTTAQAQRVDDRLKLLSDSVFYPVRGMEGGFYIASLNQFYGYSYPTSPPPIPVYGPPPRSYNFIKNQVLESIADRHGIVRLHQFDPAIFPLATEPMMVSGQPEVVVWARIHIERELPAIRLRQVINIGAMTSLAGFVIALWISISQRNRIQRLSQDLEQVRSGNAVQVVEAKGTMGLIGRSINAMVRTIRDENTKREQLERALHQKQKMASLGKVIAGVAHEVKTPLAIIKTRIQMWQQALRDASADSRGRNVITNDSLQLVVDEVDRLSDLVRRLLIFSKPQPTIMEPIDINDLLKQTISFWESRSAKRRIEIVTEFDSSLPPIPADKNALRQVFINVLMNATESIPREGTIRVTTTYDVPRNNCQVTISDTGVGIPEDLRQSIFDPFVTTKKKGFGLGLSISYEIVAAHGGNIQLSPNRNTVGTTCRIDLPAAKHRVDAKR